MQTFEYYLIQKRQLLGVLLKKYNMVKLKKIVTFGYNFSIPPELN